MNKKTFYLIILFIPLCVADDLRTPENILSADGSIIALSCTDDYIVAGSDTGFVYLFDKKGGFLWQRKLSDRVTSARISANSIVANTMDEKLYLFNISGEMKEYMNIAGYTEYGEALHLRDESIVMGTRSGYVYFFEGGVEKWSYRTDTYVIETNIFKDLVKVVSDKRIYLFDFDGRILLNKSFSSYIRSTSVSRKYFAVGLGNNELVLVDNNGTLVWSSEVGDQIGVIDISENVVCGLRNGEVHVFDLGGLKVHKSMMDAPVVSISTLANKVVAGTSGNKLYLLNVYEGVEWSCDTVGYVTASHLSSDYLIAGTSRGELYYLRMFRDPEQLRIVTGFIIVSLLIATIILIISLRY
ncbi:MAG: DUF5711 family protein [Candidatus Altiarchaeota archaeon]|nr:DUF5711 family protein [Candidatus Altiarchaeota archaeon]